MAATATAPITTNPIDDRIESWIDAIVDPLIGNFGLLDADREDLKQDLRLWLLEIRPTHDSQRSSWHTFANRALKSRLNDILKERTTIKRGWKCVLTSDATAEPGEAEDGLLADDHAADHLDPSAGADIRQSDLAMDLQRAMQSLPADLRAIATRLMTSDPKDAWRELGMKKSTFYDAVIRIRSAFTKVGLEAYAA